MLTSASSYLTVEVLKHSCKVCLKATTVSWEQTCVCVFFGHCNKIPKMWLTCKKKTRTHLCWKVTQIYTYVCTAMRNLNNAKILISQCKRKFVITNLYLYYYIFSGFYLRVTNWSIVTAYLVAFCLSIYSICGSKAIYFCHWNKNTSTTKESNIYIFGFVQGELIAPLGHNKCSL